MNRREVGAATLVDIVVRLAFERVELSSAHLELLHMLPEMADVVAHGRAEALARIDDPFEAALETSKQRIEGVKLNPVEELFLARHVVIDPGQADLGLGGDAPHRGLVVPHLAEDPCRSFQQLKPLAVESGGPFARRLEWLHLAPFERPFGNYRPQVTRA